MIQKHKNVIILEFGLNDTPKMVHRSTKSLSNALLLTTDVLIN